MLSWNDKDVTTSSGSTTQLELFKRLHEQWKQAESQGVFIDSKAHISLSAFLAVMHGSAHLSIADRKALETALQQASIDIVADKQQNPHAGDNTAIYGVHTGLGGTADTRSRDAQAAQASLITHLNAGMSNHLHDARVTRGAMVLRVLAMTRGGSAVRLEVIEALVKLIEARVVPCVPLRGSIGDSGDLIPLSYVAGLISGRFNHDAKAATDFKGHFLTGHQALLLAGVPKPITFTAKEALALVNGTSFSCAMAASCVLDAHSLTLLVQILTAFSTEVLAGDVDAFDPAVARLRPHPRQVEVCTNITHLLRDSKLAAKDKSARVPLLWRHTMPRDRYSIRAASQWLCPLVECLGQITKTLEIEINSVTDNPLVDVETKSILHGGNFQALSVADAMDRLRLQLHNAGRLIFAQHSELMNPTTNQGLPANLAWGPAGTDFGFKGLDVSMASYLSELGDLALPMSVQSAELHNQSVNSLISARKTAHAIEILQMMCACLMAALCQAADLRAVESAICKRVFITISKQVRDLGIRNSNRLIPLLEDAIAVKLTEHRELELSDCITLAVESASGKLVASPECAHLTVLQLKGFSDSLFQGIQKDIDASLQEVGNGLGYSVLSSSSRNLYSHIRNRVKM
ncbi:L-Aspartase-like protein [Obelidium mucronatum]|nr:L-Aspartase-like protein [Obelidium mucronatum]